MSSTDNSAKMESMIQAELKKWVSWKYDMALKELSMSDPFLQIHSLMTINMLRYLDRAFYLHCVDSKPFFSKIIYDLIPEYRHFFKVSRCDFTPIPDIQKMLTDISSTKESSK